MALCPWRHIYKVQRKLRDRVAAGEMAMPVLARASAVKDGLSPETVYVPSLNERARRIATRMELNDYSNMKRRVWNPSKPVLHISAACWTLINHAKLLAGGSVSPDSTITLHELWSRTSDENSVPADSEGTGIPIGDMFGDPAFVEELVAQSEYFADQIRDTGLIKPSDNLIRFTFEQ